MLNFSVSTAPIFNPINRDVNKVLLQENISMQFIYRGHVYDYIPVPPKPYIKPRAINWRYRIATKH